MSQKSQALLVYYYLLSFIFYLLSKRGNSYGTRQHPVNQITSLCRKNRKAAQIFVEGKARKHNIKADYSVRNVYRANANEAIYGISKADFVSKLHISLKETAETEYWIRLLNMSDYIDDKMSESLLNDCLELKRILIASINTAKENANNK